MITKLLNGCRCADLASDGLKDVVADFLHQLSEALKTDALPSQSRSILTNFIECLLARAVTSNQVGSSTATTISKLGEILCPERIDVEAENHREHIKRKKPSTDYIPLSPEETASKEAALLGLLYSLWQLLMISNTVHSIAFDIHKIVSQSTTQPKKDT